MALTLSGTSGISGVDGSASAPSVIGSDSNTGVSFASDTVNVNTAGTTRATITDNQTKITGSNGNVTTNQYGHIFLQNTNNSSTNFWGISPRDNGNLDLGYGTKSSNLIGGDVLTIDTNGDIGIGTNNTTHRLTVQNATNQQVGQFLAGSTSYNETVLQAACSRNITNGTYNHFKCSINGVADKMRVRDSGNVQNTNNSYGSLSDETLKENIVDATSQWDDIKNIKVRKFNFKESVDPAKPTLLGVIAQEAELVCPNLIETDVQLQAGEEKEYKSFKYSVLYMKAIKALQEAQVRIETLETKVAALESA